MPKHHLSCHCGAVSFDVDVEIKGLGVCNCSMCGRAGMLMLFVPRDAVENLTGEDNLTDYQFGQKRLHHPFCSTCGVRTIGWGKDSKGNDSCVINARCIEGIDVHTLEIEHRFDGKSL